MAMPDGLSGRRGGLLVSALISGSSGLGSIPARGHCIMFLGKTFDSHSASLHPTRCTNGYQGIYCCNELPSHTGGRRNIPNFLLLQKLG